MIKATMVLAALLTVTLARGAAAQTSADSASWYEHAVQLGNRADSLASGTAADRRQAADLLRQAGVLLAKLDARRDLATVDNYLGFVFSDLDQPDSSLKYLRQALSIRHDLADRSLEATTLSNIGDIFRTTSRPDSALAYDRLALAMMHAAGDRSGEALALGNMGLVFVEIGLPDSALAYDREVLNVRLATGDSVGAATTLFNMGTVFERTGQPDSALVYDRRGLPILHAAGERRKEASGLQNIGLVFEDVGQLDSALAYFRQALPIDRLLGNRTGEAIALSNLGTIFDGLGQSDTALAYERPALAIARAVHDQLLEANVLGNMSVAFTSLGQVDSSLAVSRLALPLRRAVGDRDGEAATLLNLAGAFGAKNQSDSALAYERQALPIEHAAGNRTGEAAMLGDIGATFIALGVPDSALMYERMALPLRRAVGDRAGEAVTLQNIGTVFRWTGRADSAASYYEQAAILYAGVSKHAGSEFNQLSYNETTSRAFAGWMLTWLDVAHGGGDSAMASQATYAALAAAERGRAQALRQLMGTSRELAPGANLAVEGEALAVRAVQSAAGALIYSIAGDTLVTWLILPHGDLVTSVQTVAHAAFDTLVAAMRYGVAGDDTKPNRGRGGALDPTTLPAAIVARALADSGRALRRELAELLLPPNIRKRLPATGELIVVPQGGLSLIPFGLLPVDSAGAALLGDRHALRYGPSLTAIIDAENRPVPPGVRGTDRARRLSPVLIVGDPTMPSPFRLAGKSYALGDLPGARDEGRAVADSLGGGVQWLTGDQATEAAVRAQLPAARLVHLATHGMVFSSDAHARLSFVALAPDAHHDGHLSVATIVDSLTLRAELVVLSACQTAVGDIKSAEGTLGLQRAMLAKGARSVLVSLWNVSDVATLFLVQRFYHHWLHDANQPTKSEALRLAQADVRTEARNAAHPDHHDWSDPYYWAAFQLVGAP